MTYSISRVTRNGWMDVQENALPVPFLRKRIIIETLDQDGQVLSTSEASVSDKK